MSQITFSKADILDSDIQAVIEVLNSGWLTHGKYTKQFEEDLAKYTGAAHAVSVSNCTAGLHLSCLAMGVGGGDEVIVPAMTHTATAHAVEFTGAKAVFSDVDPLTGNATAELIATKITAATKGVIVVHMAGYACEMDGIVDLCRKHGLFLIEDCAHALGTYYKGKHVGTFGSLGNYSFYPTKQITTGEGGMVVSNDAELAGFVKKNKAFGIDTPPEKRTVPGIYDVQSLGYNYRMTDFQAALGYGQMLRYPENLAKRKANAKRYVSRLSKLRDHVEVVPYSEDCSYFLMQALVRDVSRRNEIVMHLGAAGIGCSIHYATPVPLMTYYKQKYGFTEAAFPGAVAYANRNVSLPVHPYLTVEEIDQVCAALEGFFAVH